MQPWVRPSSAQGSVNMTGSSSSGSDHYRHQDSRLPTQTSSPNFQSAPIATSCLLRCPQCQHLINLLASLASQQNSTNSVMPSAEPIQHGGSPPTSDCGVGTTAGGETTTYHRKGAPPVAAQPIPMEPSEAISSFPYAFPVFLRSVSDPSMNASPVRAGVGDTHTDHRHESTANLIHIQRTSIVGPMDPPSTEPVRVQRTSIVSFSKRTAQQNIRLPTGQTVRLVSNPQRSRARSVSLQLPAGDNGGDATGPSDSSGRRKPSFNLSMNAIVPTPQSFDGSGAAATTAAAAAAQRSHSNTPLDALMEIAPLSRAGTMAMMQPGHHHVLYPGGRDENQPAAAPSKKAAVETTPSIGGRRVRLPRLPHPVPSSPPAATTTNNQVLQPVRREFLCSETSIADALQEFHHASDAGSYYGGRGGQPSRNPFSPSAFLSQAFSISSNSTSGAMGGGPRSLAQDGPRSIGSPRSQRDHLRDPRSRGFARGPSLDPRRRSEFSILRADQRSQRSVQQRTDWGKGQEPQGGSDDSLSDEEMRIVDVQHATVSSDAAGASSLPSSAQPHRAWSHLWKLAKKRWVALGRHRALDDSTKAVQIVDVLFTVFSVFLCCFALFHDTIGETAKRYIGSVFFWIDLIVVIPVEWMVVPLLRNRDVSWWVTKTPESAAVNFTKLNFTSTAVPAVTAKWYDGRDSWEAAASVLSFLMLRHFLRYWRIASLISSSNPIVSERSIFRFLTAVAIALAVVCTCAVAFQAWEGPTLAPLLALDGGKFGNSASANYTALLAAVAGDNFAAVTTPVLFASFDALYWSITTALSVGYGDITPRTPGGRAIAMLTMILGSALLSTMTAIATSYFANKDPVQQELEERKRKMTSMLEFFEVPWDLQRDVIASFPAVMEAHSKAAFLDMIEHLPEICRKRVEGYSRLRLLRRIHLFEGIEREHAFMLAKCLTQRFVAAQDVVVQQGELGNEMYFVVQGMLDVLVQVATMDSDEHIVVATIREGSFFGERGLLEDTPRAATVMAITLTELLVLTRADFQDIVTAIPEVMDLFRRNVFELNEEAARSIAVDLPDLPWLPQTMQPTAISSGPHGTGALQPMNPAGSVLGGTWIAPLPNIVVQLPDVEEDAAAATGSVAMSSSKRVEDDRADSFVGVDDSAVDGTVTASMTTQRYMNASNVMDPTPGVSNDG